MRLCFDLYPPHQERLAKESYVYNRDERNLKLEKLGDISDSSIRELVTVFCTP